MSIALNVKQPTEREHNSLGIAVQVTAPSTVVVGLEKTYFDPVEKQWMWHQVVSSTTWTGKVPSTAFMVNADFREAGVEIPEGKMLKMQADLELGATIAGI